MNNGAPMREQRARPFQRLVAFLFPPEPSRLYLLFLLLLLLLFPLPLPPLSPPPPPPPSLPFLSRSSHHLLSNREIFSPLLITSLYQK